MGAGGGLGRHRVDARLLVGFVRHRRRSAILLRVSPVRGTCRDGVLVFAIPRQAGRFCFPVGQFRGRQSPGVRHRRLGHLHVIEGRQPVESGGALRVHRKGRASDRGMLVHQQVVGLDAHHRTLSGPSLPVSQGSWAASAGSIRPGWPSQIHTKGGSSRTGKVRTQTPMGRSAARGRPRTRRGVESSAVIAAHQRSLSSSRPVDSG